MLYIFSTIFLLDLVFEIVNYLDWHMIIFSLSPLNINYFDHSFVSMWYDQATSEDRNNNLKTLELC